MSNPETADLPALSPSDQEDVERACERFKASWKAAGTGGPRPRVEDYLDQQGEPVRLLLLRELILLDLYYRRLNGEQPQPEDYHGPFPNLDSGWLTQVTLVKIATARPIRCPHCHSPIQLADDCPQEVLCPCCGGSFCIQETHPTDTTSPMRQLGKFQLMERVGLGGFGAVWKARDTELQRIVALKNPHAALLSNTEAAERFAREARATAQLRHPSIVTVHEVTTLDDLPAIVADFIEGVTLREYLEAHRLSFRESAELVAQVAEALDYAHNLRPHGIVHRDVKPANIMLEQTKDAKAAAQLRPLVMDFGVALREAEVTLTVDGQLLGTPAYMSPEQAAGRSHAVDRRSDVYSLGVVLYELLTGELPFRGSRQMMIHQVLHEEPRPPRRLNDRLPRDLETICLTSLQKEPGKRYATARAMSEDLRRFLDGKPIAARPATRLERGWKWVRRHPARAGLLGASAVALLLLVAGLVGLLFGAQLHQANLDLEAALHEARQQRQAADTEKAAADALKARAEQKATELEARLKNLGMEFQAGGAGLDRLAAGGFRLAATVEAQLKVAKMHERSAVQDRVAAQEERDLYKRQWLNARQYLYSAHLVLAQRAWEAKHNPRVRELLEMERPQRQSDKDFRGFEWYYLWQRLHHEPAGHAQTQTTRAHARKIAGVAFSPDGRRLASGSWDKTIKIFDLGGLKEVLVLRGHRAPVHCVAFSRDGRYLASAGGDPADRTGVSDLKVWDLTTAQEVFSRGGHQGAVWCVAFSPDGKWLASGGEDRTVRIWNSVSGQEVRTLAGHAMPVISLTYYPDGKRLAAATGAAVKTWDTNTWQEIRLLRDDRHSCLAVSPDGKHLATATGDHTVKLSHAVTGWEVFALRGHTGKVTSVAFSPDGRRLATGSMDQTVKTWLVETGEELLTLQSPSGGVQCVRFSADGRFLASANEDGTLGLWDGTPGERAAP